MRNLPYAQARRHRLRNHRRQRHAVRRHAQIRHKHNIQHDIEQAGHNQIDQRRDRIAQTAQNTGADIVIRRAHDAHGDDGQIINRHIVYIRRGIQQGHQWLDDDRAHRHDDQARDERERETSAYAFFQIILLMRAEILRDKDARASRDTHKQKQQEIENRAAGTDSRQSAVADILADDDRVCRIVHLLGQIADEQRHGEGNQVGERLADGHVLRAKEFLESVHVCFPFLR